MTAVTCERQAGEQEAGERDAFDRALASVRHAFLTAGVFSLFINVLMLAGPLYMLQVYDRVLTSQSIPTLVALTMLLIVLYIALGLLEGVRSQVLNRVAGRRLLALEREAERGRGELAALAASIAGAETKLHEVALSIHRIDQTFHEKITEELRAVEAELNTFSQKLVSIEDQTQRTEIRAPRRGRVLNLAVHNPGGVIRPGETIMEIVPDDDTLVIGARVAPQDVDKVAPRATATVRLSAFNQRTTPELFGEVQRVSADLVPDAAGGPPSYQAVIEIPPREAERLQGLVLVPGMPADVFIRTGGRTPLSYLLKPLTDSFTRALRED